MSKLDRYSCKFNPISVTTRRWSSSMHTLGTNSAIKECIETGFITSSGEPDGFILGFDASQAEVRTVGYLADEQTLLQAYRDGLDIHTVSASKMFKKPMDQVTKTERSVAKGLTFGLLYGKSPESFYRDGVFKTLAEAQEAFDSFFNAYPKIKEFIDLKHNEVLEIHGTMTALGDKIDINFDPYKEYEVAEAQRQAVNFPIQHYSSCSAAIVIDELDNWGKKNNINFNPFNFVHDAGYFDISVVDFYKLVPVLRSKVVELYKELTELDMDIDIGVAISLGDFDKCEFEVINEKEFIIYGKSSVVDEILKRTSRHFNLDIEILEVTKSKLSLAEMFLKSSFNIKLGKEFENKKVKIALKSQIN